MVDREALLQQVYTGCRRILAEQNLDPHTQHYGCMDRRYWGWKLVDYPEATFQRNIYPLAWLLTDPGNHPFDRAHLTGAIQAGLRYATRIQHRNGSFDQAFPNEYSFGATAFLLHPLLKAFEAIGDDLPVEEQSAIRSMLYRGAAFLCRHHETHGWITNHLAGAVLSLLACGRLFDEPQFASRAADLLDGILKAQSPEGWFPEYGGADPGYQTLAIYYLAQIHELDPRPDLLDALDRAVQFLVWFAHPDGSFGGEYGSRRTALYYPGGIALLADRLSQARALNDYMLSTLADGRTPGPAVIDFGNLAPTLSSWVLALSAPFTGSKAETPPLPCQIDRVRQSFDGAGLVVIGQPAYYSILGAGSGGVLKVFRRPSGEALFDDGGYVGTLKSGKRITTQIDGRSRMMIKEDDSIEIEAPFFEMLDSTPGPFQMLVIRALNLTLMRSIWLGNLVKGLLVRMLISGKRPIPLTLTRNVQFADDRVVVSDTIRASRGAGRLSSLEFGRPFVGIHMASARYYGAVDRAPIPARQVDVEQLNETGMVQEQTII